MDRRNGRYYAAQWVILSCWIWKSYDLRGEGGGERVYTCIHTHSLEFCQILEGNRTFVCVSAVDSREYPNVRASASYVQNPITL